MQDFKLVGQIMSDTTEELPFNDLALYNFAFLLNEKRDIKWNTNKLDKLFDMIKQQLNDFV